MRQRWHQVMTYATGDGPSLSNSAAATSILPPANVITLLPEFWEVGAMLRITGHARLSNIVTTPGTLTLDVRLGAVIAFNGGAMQLSTTVHTTLPLWFEILLTCRAIGNGVVANLMGAGRATSQALSLTAVADSATTPATLNMPNVAPVVGTGFNSTTSQTLDLFATFSIANAGNLLQLHQYVVESLN